MLIPKMNECFYGLVSVWLARMQSIFDIIEDAKIRIHYEFGEIYLGIEIAPSEDISEGLMWSGTNSTLIVDEAECYHVCIRYNSILADMYESEMRTSR